MKGQITTSLKSATSFRIFFACFIFMSGVNLTAQSYLSLYTELGENNVSHGLYFESAVIGQCKFGNNNLGTGFQFDLDKSYKTIFSGYTINASRHFVIKGIHLELQGFCIRTDFSQILCETNLGAFLKMNRNHFEMTIGTNFRTYSFSQKAVKDYEIERNAAKITEVYNIMYSFRYNLKPLDSRWNAGVSVTDIDYFVINQETNPILNLYGFYRLSSPVNLYTSVSYKIAGATNIAVNYFGLFLKTGIIWNF